MQTQTIRRVRSGACVLLAAATLALAGCHQNQSAVAPGGGPDTQQEQAIQQNAAAQADASKHAPQMGTAGSGAAPAAGVGANHP